MSKLLIVESPGKIKKIQEYLGPDYIVMASFGHIIDLDEKTMSIDLETFEPFYYQYPNKVDTINKLISTTLRVGKHNVYLAADEDREGEMIAWSLQRELQIHNGKRIVFNSITEKELNNAVSNPKLVDMNMLYAQQARRILDRLAGYLISPLLYKNGFRGAQSAGRVQSVVVKIIVDKEKEINQFYSQAKSTYFYINCLVKLGEHDVLTKLTDINANVELSDRADDADAEIQEIQDVDNEVKKKGKKKVKVNTENTVSSKSYITFDKNDEQKVIQIIKAMCKAEYLMMGITEKTKKTNAPAPFTTSTLQQLASQRLGMDAKKTMSVAQKLYEGGHITYMRTDSTSISEEALNAIKKTIKDEWGEQYFEAHKFINKKANTQEAHECIRPTKPMYSEIEGTNDEKKLYSMIWKRTIQSQMKAAEYQSLMIEIKLNDKKNILENYKLVGTIENLFSEGWMIVDGKKGNAKLDIKKLKNLQWMEINGIEDTSKPPSRYNDASLINKMDPKNLNIGRPSTYATFIEKITTRGYVEIKDFEGMKIQTTKYIAHSSNPKIIDVESKEIVIGKEKKKLVPTELGFNITEFLELNFSMIMDYKFTAQMEKELDDVAEGIVDKNKMIRSFYAYLSEQISTIKPLEKMLCSNIIIGKTDLGIDIILKNGIHGKYLICGNKNLNLKNILLNNQYGITENNIESNSSALIEIVNRKLQDINLSSDENNNTTDKTGTANNERKIYKEWKKGKTKYLLRKGEYGFYLEELGSNGIKKANWAMKFLINKIANANGLTCSDDNIDEITDKITIDDILANIEYLKNMKNKNKNKK